MSAIPAGGQPRAGVARLPDAAAGARVYLHLPAKRAYVASVLAPVSRTLALHRDAIHVHAYPGWRFGPHLDVRAESSSAHPIDWAAAAEALARGARAFPPPSPDVSQRDYLRTASLLGRLEAVPPPYLPFRGHGHTELLGPDTSALWRGRLGRLRAQGLAHLLAPVLDAAAAPSDGAAWAAVAEAFVALADTHPHGLRFGTFSLRSHAEAFFQWAGPAADYRASFNVRMGKDRAVLDELVRRVRDGAESGLGAAWRRAFNDCMADFADQVSAGDLEPADVAMGSRLDRGTGPSAFHAAIGSSGVIDRPPSWFAAYRLVINLFYQVLPALDVSPVRRFYLCHAIAESVDGVFGETWQDRLAALQTHQTVGAS